LKAQKQRPNEKGVDRVVLSFVVRTKRWCGGDEKMVWCGRKDGVVRTKRWCGADEKMVVVRTKRWCGADKKMVWCGRKDGCGADEKMVWCAFPRSLVCLYLATKKLK